MRSKNLKGRGIHKSTAQELIDKFEEDAIADASNITNEKQLNKTIRKVVAHNKKMSLKPINTHQLLSNK